MSPEVIPFARSARGERGNSNMQLDKAGQTILQLLNKAADVAEQTADMRSIRRKSWRTSYALPRTVFPTLRRKSRRISSGQSALKSGSIASTPKLRIDFCGRVVSSEARHNERREQIGASVELSPNGARCGSARPKPRGNRDI
jgi:hypothetical protein